MVYFNQWWPIYPTNICVSLGHEDGLTEFLCWDTLTALRHHSMMVVNILALRSHGSDVIMGAMASQITSLTIVYSTDQRKHQSSAPLAFVWGIHRSPVNSPHKWPVTRKMFPFDDVIMRQAICNQQHGDSTVTLYHLNYIMDHIFFVTANKQTVRNYWGSQLPVDFLFNGGLVFSCR